MNQQTIMLINSLKLSSCTFFKTNTNILLCRYFATTKANALKEVKINTVEQKTVVEGVYIDSAKKDKQLLLNNQQEFCPLCPNKLGVKIKYTDVLILSQFLRDDGCMLPKRATGLCDKAQKNLSRLVWKAQRAGLMPELRPPRRNGEDRSLTRSPYKWRKYNVYFDHNEYL